MPDQMTTRDDALQRASRIKLMIFDVDGVLTDCSLYFTDAGTEIKARLAGQAGDIREPDWGPFQKQ